MTNALDIRYAKNGDTHIAYCVEGAGGGIDVLRIGAYLSHLEHLRRVPAIATNIARLASLGRLIDFDGRGMGLSDRMCSSLPAIEERLDDLIAVLDDAGSERVLVCAFADGGPLGCLFAATCPDRTLGLVLMNTRPRIAWAPDYPWGMNDREYRQQLRRIEEGWGTRSLALEDARDFDFGMSFDDAVDWHLAEMRLCAGPGDAAALLRMFYESDVRDVLGTIRVPTLVLSRGGAMGDEGRAFAELIPGARHLVMPGTSRIVLGDHTDSYFSAVEEFAADLADEEAELESILATVLFTDIVGSTRKQAELGDRRWAGLVSEHHRCVRGLLARYRGRELDTAGDGFFAAFDGPARAIRCAQAITTSVSELGIEVRAGLHTGECRTIEGKVGGLAVSIGARVTALAGPSEVYVSQTVRDLVAGSGLAFAERGEHELKGVPGSWRVYAVA